MKGSELINGTHSLAGALHKSKSIARLPTKYHNETQLKSTFNKSGKNQQVPNPTVSATFSAPGSELECPLLQQEKQQVQNTTQQQQPHVE